MTKSIVHLRGYPKIKLLMVGIAGTNRDFLLSVPTLKSYLLANDSVRANVDVELCYYPYIEKEKKDESCESILSDIKKIKPDLVGFSVYVWNIDSVLRLSSAIKADVPSIKIIFGGPEIAANDLSIGRFDNVAVDFLILGEGEQPLLELLLSLIGQDAGSLASVSGLAYRSGKNFQVNGPIGSQNDHLLDLSKIPSPYLSGVITKDILSRPNMRAGIETQRGCNFRCAYCMYHKNFTKIRYRDAQTVINEIEHIYNNGIAEFRITDANFFSKKEFAAYILSEMLRRKIKMSFFLEVIPHYIDEDIAVLMSKLILLSPQNKITVGLGLQSINQKSLRAIRRSIDVKCFDRAFDLLKKINAVIKTDLILGLPYETMGTYFGLLEYISEKMRYGNNILSLSLLRILPGSDMEAIALRAGMITDKRDNEHFVYCTEHMPRMDMVFCLRMNTVAYRIFSTVHFENRKALRDLFFRVKDSLNVTNVELLKYFTGFFYKTLGTADSDYLKDDFPNAEVYYSSRVYLDISDELIVDELNKIEKEGGIR